MGAGGGYAEKTYSAAGGTLLTINVGSPAFSANACYTNTSNIISGVNGLYANALAVGSSVVSDNLPANTVIQSIQPSFVTKLANTVVNTCYLIFRDTANVVPGYIVEGPGLKETTCIVSIIDSQCANINKCIPITLSNGSYVVYGANVTLSAAANATSMVGTCFTGMSSSGVSGTGISAVSATNATEATICYTCTNPVAARDGSYDPDITAGFRLPVCGYQICYNGWYNIPGNGSGGDVNRKGGAGVLVPEFVATSCIDMYKTGGGAAVNCGGWVSPYIYCGHVGSYHTVFGVTWCCGSVFPNCYPCNCICPFVCNNICNYAAGSSIYQKFTVGGAQTQAYDASTDQDSMGRTLYASPKPIGVGATAGTSAGIGRRASAPDQVLESNWPSSSGGTAFTPAASFVSFTCAGYGYDTVFGGSQCTQWCQCMHMGCVYGTTLTSPVCGANEATSFCYRCTGSGFSAVFGSYVDNMQCFCFRYAPSGGGGTSYKCTGLSFVPENIASDSYQPYTFRLSSLINETGQPQNDLEYATGAALEKASFGGGGNRWNPVGGTGLVVVTW
jgi:hypothetical protein